MQALKSSILIISEQSLENLTFEVDYLAPDQINESTFVNSAYDVIALDLQAAMHPQFDKSFHSLIEKNPSVQFVLVEPEENDDDLSSLAIINHFSIYRVSNIDDPTELENHLLESLEKAQAIKQDLKLEELTREQSHKLKELYQDLEDRVEKRQNYLIESRNRTHQAQKKWESLKESLLVIFRAISIGEIESTLTESLSPLFNIKVVRIFFKSQINSNLVENLQRSFSCYESQLFEYNEELGKVFFLREKTKPFVKDEIDFLARVTEAISLAISRIAKLELSENLKEQWQATFNAVVDPISIINENYEVLQHNSTFSLHSPNEPVIGKKCYKVLFGRTSICPGCQLGKNFRIDISKSNSRAFDVHSQQLNLNPLGESAYVNLYHDVTEQIRLEAKILENAKLAELGTIGSSIAHELNNPLGGVLSFVQLIKMDLKPSDPIYADIEEMEIGVKRCRDIIQNLLSFTRDPVSDEKSQFDLKETIERAVKIIELQTRARGIEIKIIYPPKPCPFEGHKNLISQAFQNVLQISVESLIESIQTHKGSQPLIEIHLDIKENFEIVIFDNSVTSGHTNSLALSIAKQIVHEHGGSFEINSHIKQMKSLKIILPLSSPAV